MKLFNTILLSSALLVPMAVHASIDTDVKANVPMKVIFDNAFSEQSTLNNIFTQIAAADKSFTPAATTYATCNKLDSNEVIIGMAFLAAPELAEEIANAARSCGATEEELLNSALASNIDPTTIGEATAAGGALPGATGGTGTPLAAADFGSAGGNGGGNTASLN